MARRMSWWATSTSSPRGSRRPRRVDSTKRSFPMSPERCISSRGSIRCAHSTRRNVEMLPQAGDDLVRDCDRNKMSPWHKVGLAAGEGLCHLPGHGGWDDDVVEALPQGHVAFLGQFGG